ncbi:MAG: glycosyltransferase family 4 protein [Phycisphaeraceae bacterium]|nr:glycosyltransferase family 4 protein [Phycisphaeraceae bacterium]
MKRVGLVLSAIDPRRTGGAETYCRKLAATLPRVDPQTHYLAFVGRGCAAVAGDGMEVIELPIDPACRYRRILWEQTTLPKVLRRAGLDLVHFPYNTIPFRWRGPGVVTIHDAQRFVSPAGMSGVELAYRAWIEARIARSSLSVVSPSHSDETLLARHLGLKAERICVVYHGMDEKFLDAGARVIQRRPEVIWFGRPYLRKNVALLVRVWAELPEHVLVRLRLIGVSGEDARALVKMAGKWGVSQRVSIEPACAHEQLPALIAGAMAVCYPSRYESFGLPVLEALAAGTPVLCSDISTFRELFGQVSWLGPLDDPKPWAQFIAHLHDSPEQIERRGQTGRAYAATFTWERCARQTAELYRNLLAAGHLA